MKKITYKISLFKEQGIGAWMYTYFVTFPIHPDYAYTIKATLEGFTHISEIWRQAGYEIECLNPDQEISH